MKQILEDHRGLIIEADFESVKETKSKSEQIEKE